MDIIKKSHRNPVIKHQNVIAEEKQNVHWKGIVKLTVDVARPLPKKVFLGYAEGEWNRLEMKWK